MEIERLVSNNRGAVLDVLCAAFYDYPVMRFVLSDGVDDYDHQLRALIGYYCDNRFVNRWPVLGIQSGGRTVAVALVSEPVLIETTADRQIRKDNLRAIIGETAYTRMERFENVSDAGVPPGSYHFVGMLGVHPDHQRMGFGQALLKHTKTLAVEYGSVGICLSTEDSDNVTYYQRLGFEVVAEGNVDDLHTWCFCWQHVPAHLHDQRT